MIEKKVVICIGTDEAKHVRARLSLLLIDGNEVISRQYHSISIEPGANLAAIRAGNEAHIAKPNGGVPGAPWPAIPDNEWEKVEKCCTAVHDQAVLFKSTVEAKRQLADLKLKRAELTKETEALEAEVKQRAKLKAELASEVEAFEAEVRQKVKLVREAEALEAEIQRKAELAREAEALEAEIKRRVELAVEKGQSA